MLETNLEYVYILISIFLIVTPIVLKIRLGIKYFFLSVGVIIATVITTYLFLSWKLSNYTSKLFEYEDRYWVVQRFIGEIEQNVANLTKLARLYVATGNSKYLENYFKVLDIRNGYLPVPENYSQKYWNSSIGEIEKTDQSNSLSFLLL